MRSVLIRHMDAPVQALIQKSIDRNRDAFL